MRWSGSIWCGSASWRWPASPVGLGVLAGSYVASFDVIALVATLAGGYPIFKEAVANLLARRMTMELSMTIALAAALAIGEFFTALVIVLFVLVAEVLEGLTVGRGRRAIKDLLDLLPQQAVVRRGGGTQEVGAAEVQVGDVVLVKPGARVPVDGVVVAGNSFVDQAPITGESLPVEKLPGQQRLRRDHQPVRRHRGPHRGHRAGHRLRQDHRGGGAGRAVPCARSRRPPTGWPGTWSTSPSAAPC